MPQMVLQFAALVWSVLTIVVPILAHMSVGALIFGRVLLGIAEGVTYPALYYILREYVLESQRSKAIAAVSIGALAGAVLSFIITPLLITLFGWSSVFYVFGGIIGPTFLVCWSSFFPYQPPKAMGLLSSSDELHPRYATSYL